jgi:hypothetical protein
MTWVTGATQVGIIVLSGPVARVSRILALEDLSRSSGWPIVGVVGVPRMRRRWWGRRAQPQADPGDNPVFTRKKFPEAPAMTLRVNFSRQNLHARNPCFFDLALFLVSGHEFARVHVSLR